MGVVAYLQTLSDENIRKVLADPPLVWMAIAPEEPDLYSRARQEKQGGFFQRLFGKKLLEPAPASLSLQDGEGETIDLDKSWHGIHYLLTLSADGGHAPLDFMVVGGAQVGDIEVGYGPARVFTSDEVRALHLALQSMNAALLSSRFNPADMMKLEIYPEIWGRASDTEELLDYCLENFETMASFIAEAAKRNMGLLVTMQ
jgi:hypothetical protein